MELQVVSNLNLVNNEATSCFRAQTSQEMKLQVDSNFKQPKMKVQVVFNFKRVRNGATSCFQLQSSQ